MNIPEWLLKLAPTVATALGGPLAGIAVAALGNALGVPDATQEKISDILQSGNMTGEQIAAVKVAELELKKHESDNGFKFAELEVRDRESARAREATVKDTVNQVLAYTIVGAFLAMVGTTLLGYATVDSVLAGTLVGYLSAKCEQVLAYYFGSSKGSERKSELLSQSTPNK